MNSVGNKYFAKDVSVSTAEQTMKIIWDDEHCSGYPLEGLRLACPCVECAGGHHQMGRQVDADVFRKPATRTWEIAELREVGNYALQIFWGDGHNTGIYQWRSLRELCPCEACQPG